MAQWIDTATVKRPKVMSSDGYGQERPGALAVVWEGPCRPVPPGETVKRDGRKSVVIAAPTVLFPLAAVVVEADTVQTALFTGTVETVAQHHTLKRATLKAAQPGA